MPICSRIVPALLAAVCLAAPALAGRFEDFTNRYANTPDQAKVEGATLFGGKGTEWFSAGGFQPDGTIVAAGTTLGPDLAAPVKVTILGRDGPAPAEPQQAVQRDKGGKEKRIPFSWKHENATGFLVRYGSDLKTVKSVTRLPWKSGAITSAVIDKEGNIYIAGSAAEGILSITSDHRALPVQDSGSKKFSTSHIYVAKLNPAADKVLWLRTLKGPSISPKLDINKAGKITLQGPDIRVLSPQGQVESITNVPGGLEGNVAVNPVDGTYARGGEHHWATGREPWRCPTLNIYKPDGTQLYHLYDWGGPYVGMDNIRQVSDSAVRGVTYDNNGNLIIHAWSDGGNSVMVQQPNDVRRNHDAFARSLGFSNWGAGVLSCAYILKIDTKDYKVTNGTLWVAYTAGNKPNSIWIDTFGFASDGSVAIAGRSAWGLIRTGNHLGGDSPPSGPYVAVFNSGLNSIRFSSNLPSCGKTQVASDEPFGIASGTVDGVNKVLFLSGAIDGEDSYDAKDLKPPTTPGALQEKFGGGHTDAHLLLLNLGK